MTTGNIASLAKGIYSVMGARMYKAKSLAVVDVLETNAGLKKDDIAMCKPMGDGLVKIKIRPDGQPIAQINWLVHEWMHLIFLMFKARKRGRKLTKGEEEAICNRIGNFAERVFKREFKVKKEK